MRLDDTNRSGSKSGSCRIARSPTGRDAKPWSGDVSSRTGPAATTARPRAPRCARSIRIIALTAMTQRRPGDISKKRTVGVVACRSYRATAMPANSTIRTLYSGSSCRGCSKGPAAWPHAVCAMMAPVSTQRRCTTDAPRRDRRGPSRNRRGRPARSRWMLRRLTIVKSATGYPPQIEQPFGDRGDERPLTPASPLP